MGREGLRSQSVESSGKKLPQERKSIPKTQLADKETPDNEKSEAHDRIPPKPVTSKLQEEFSQDDQQRPQTPPRSRSKSPSPVENGAKNVLPDNGPEIGTENSEASEDTNTAEIGSVLQGPVPEPEKLLNPSTPVTTDDDYKKNIVVYSLAILLLSWFVYFLTFVDWESVQRSNASGQLAWDQARIQFENGIIKIRNDFGLSEETTSRLFASGDSILSEEEPNHPSCIIALFPSHLEQMEDMITSYASLINTIFSKLFSSPQTPTFQFSHTYFQAISGGLSLIHNDLDVYFTGGGRAVIVHDVDKLSSDKEAMVFHSLCDDFYANEKRAMVIFMVPVPDSISTSVEWTDDVSHGVAFKTMNKIWESLLSPSFRSALIARVAREVILAGV